MLFVNPLSALWSKRGLEMSWMNEIHRQPLPLFLPWTLAGKQG
jgi:hypothetical protein